MIEIKNKANCCGCTACKNICPRLAIDLRPDTEGFLYPYVNNSLCIQCGLCLKVCSFNNGYNTQENFEKPLVYAVKHKNEKERLTSRSGGMFVAVSDYILEQGGVVYGVGYTDHFRVVHKRAINKIERDEFKGSKYVQSDLTNTFKLLKNDLKAGIPVLFSGTPCQTAGLKAYLEKSDTKNLLVCDIVCHGVPSPSIWKDYLNYIEKKYNDSIIKVDFRDKEFGWSSHKESFYFYNNKKITNNFISHHFDFIIRPACSNCKYTNIRRPGDITLADFWGIEKISTTFNKDNKGSSLVLINTPKGKKVFENIKPIINYIESNTKDCLQPNLETPTKFPENRERFWNDYNQYGFKFIGRKYGNIRLRYKIKRIIGRKTIEMIKKVIKK
jgi:coenzyme F420-reducing hydrogenase beta subunit